jgi:acyl-CoA thioester hydrolase
MSFAEAREVQMRWEDIDALGHVNHAVAFTYFEEARDGFLAERGIRRDEYVVGRCSVTWLRELKPGQHAVTVETGVRELGGSSMTTFERIFDADGEVAVEGEFGLVLWDSASRGSRPITDEERQALSSSASSAPQAEPTEEVAP